VISAGLDLALEHFVEVMEQLGDEYQTLLARERALAGVERAVRELAANILSVVRGTGKPDLIAPQALALVHTIEAHRSIAGCPPSSGEIAAVLNIAAKAERVALLNVDHKVELHATQSMISGALLIAASRLTDIRTHAPGGIEGLTEDDYGVDLPSERAEDTQD
jgi:hypothetical protein